MKYPFLPAFFLLLFSTAILSQTKGVVSEPTFSGPHPPIGIRLPVPEYPTVAVSFGLEGRLSVAVSLDQKGNVISADDADGPYPVCKSATNPQVQAMRAAAIRAALNSKFRLETPGESAVITTGRLVYDFKIVNKPPAKVIAIREDTNIKTDEDHTPQTGGLSGLAVSDSKAPVKAVAIRDTGMKIGDGSPRVSLEVAGSVAGTGATVPGGVLNGTAMTLEKPKFPAAARAVRATGQVLVQVLIGEDGMVYSAQAVQGHPLLRAASEIAACGSTFSPTLLESKPVNVAGIIIYNFVN